MSEFVNTRDVIGDEALTDSILMRTITEYKSDTVTKIGEDGFNDAVNLVNVEVPNVTEIRSRAFRKCSKLALTSLPNGVKSIGNNAFSNCTGLTNITFEGTPNSIASSAFNGCSNLKTINVPWAEGAVAGAPWGASNATINYNYTGA